jgi:hypothetical protein
VSIQTGSLGIRGRRMVWKRQWGGSAPAYSPGVAQDYKRKRGWESEQESDGMFRGSLWKESPYGGNWGDFALYALCILEGKGKSVWERTLPHVCVSVHGCWGKTHMLRMHTAHAWFLFLVTSTKDKWPFNKSRISLLTLKVSTLTFLSCFLGSRFSQN